MSASNVQALLNSVLRRTELADRLLAEQGHVLQADAIGLLNGASGRASLRELAEALHVAEGQVGELARQLMAQGLLEQTGDDPNHTAAVALPHEIRSIVERLHAVVLEHAGPEAAGHLESDARECATAGDLIVSVRRRLGDERAAMRFTTAAIEALSPADGPAAGPHVISRTEPDGKARATD